MSELDLRSFIDQGMVECINVSKDTLSFVIAETPEKARKVSLAPGKRTLIEQGYLRRERLDTGGYRPSVIDRKTCRTNVDGVFDDSIPEKLVPVDSEAAKKYLANNKGGK